VSVCAFNSRYRWTVVDSMNFDLIGLMRLLFKPLITPYIDMQTMIAIMLLVARCERLIVR
jgi:hypothetical protein